MTSSLGDFEQLVLLALLRLGDEAYGVSIRDELCARTGRDVSPGAVYTTLDRLERKGFVVHRLGPPTPERGGRRKKHWALRAPGRRALESALAALRRMTEGLELSPGTPE
jgi:DNA-binding PadR family transcriptional regulator